MSLINKMLQDLDARGGTVGAPAQAAIKLVPRVERRPARWMMASGALLLTALVASGYAGWLALGAAAVIAVMIFGRAIWSH